MSRRLRKDTPNGLANEADANGAGIKEVIPAYYFILAMVLGGCCANVWAYEHLLTQNPSMGTLITFSQMLFITLLSLPNFLVISRRRSCIPIRITLKPHRVPLMQWTFQVFVQTSSSLLNNWAFACEVPLTVQIVFRSGGLAVSMLFGYFIMKKRYSQLQITAVIIVSIGIVLATLSRPSPSPSSSAMPSSKISEQNISSYTLGILMLLLSLVLTGLLGMMQERTYRKYGGDCWREGVFYTHALSLPIFVFLMKDVRRGFQSLSTPPSPTPLYPRLGWDLDQWKEYAVLVANLGTQMICVSGVNRLSSHTTQVHTSLILTTRKAFSLVFSVWWFGNGWNWRLGVGSGMVGIGSAVFGLGGRVTVDGKRVDGKTIDTTGIDDKRDERTDKKRD